MNIQKYVDFVHATPAGLELQDRVRREWPQWVLIVRRAPWLQTWRHWLREQGGCRDEDEEVETLARRIFFSGVWGYGWEFWRGRGADADADARGVEDGARAANKVGRSGSGSGSGSNAALACLCKLQGLRRANKARVWVWDQEYLELGYGLVPCEFATMDRWLESLLIE